MEFTAPVTSYRTQLCIVVHGFSWDVDRGLAWSAAAEETLRRLVKAGVQITIIGPRPPKKFGSKKVLRFMDRHEVVGIKMLTASKSHQIELRVLNRKNHSWTRLRAEACLVVGLEGVWKNRFDGWSLPGVMSLTTFTRWVGEQKWVPGREIAFVGSDNQVLRWACEALDRGAKSCYVVEEGPTPLGWRAMRDRYLLKGGRILSGHRIQKLEQDGGENPLLMYLDNDQGTMLLHVDSVVLGSETSDALNSPEQWKRGLFYLHRRASPWRSGQTTADEEDYLEDVDWRELYYRILKYLEKIDYPEADGTLKKLRYERKEMLSYRLLSAESELKYSGKILDRDSLRRLQGSPSVPKNFEGSNPRASLECLEKVPCRKCADACPETAITIDRVTDLPHLNVDACTGCGVCVAACPAGAAVMVKDSSTHQTARYFFSDDTREFWRPGKQVQLTNRRGENLGIARVVSSFSVDGGLHRVLEVEASNVHVWDGRGVKLLRGESLATLDDAASAAQHSPTLLKRGWVELNGVRRLCPTEVPITVALWQLGVRRFEDALFCHDGGCRMCEVQLEVGGGHFKSVLACQTPVEEGMKIRFRLNDDKANNAERAKSSCYCRSVKQTEVEELRAECNDEDTVREISGFAHGRCHGRWCLSSCTNQKESKPRPVFHGFESSPWRDFVTKDIVDDIED